MTEPNLPPESPIAQENLGRLVARSWRPERPDPAFAGRVTERLLDEAAGIRAARRGALLRRVAAVAASLLVGVAIVGLGGNPAVPPGEPPVAPDAVGAASFPDAPFVAQRLAPPPAPERAAAGTRLATHAREKRRVVLDDGSVLYVDAGSSVEVEGLRRLRVAAGQVYLEVAPDPGRPFLVATPTRSAEAVGTRFAVKVADGATDLVVTHGVVRVEGARADLLAGDRFTDAGGKPRVTAEPRAAELLDWTRDLMLAAQSPLVPRSEHAGGALLAIDPNGQEARLSLRKFHVDVHVEDGFARTTIDQTYFNHAYWRMEGTFHFPLPSDASLSRLAMYVAGKRMEGGMTTRDRGREVYDEILRTRRDPALLEWVDGSTFKMRVFPLEPREEKRILLSYVQRLPELRGEHVYRFPAGHTLGFAGSWSFAARVVGGRDAAWRCDSHELGARREGGDLLLASQGADAALLSKDVVLRVAEDRAGTPRVTTFAQDGWRYVMLRWRPDVPAAPAPRRRDWVFVVESSGGRDPIAARAQIEVVRGLLAQAGAGDRFAIVAAGARPRPLSSWLLPARPVQVAAALDTLERMQLVGGLDVAAALAAARPFVDASDAPVLVHVGTGVAVLGETDPAALAALVPAKAQFVGVAVGRRHSRPYLRAAAARTGGLWTQVQPDEPAAFRALEIATSLAAPRLHGIRVNADGAGPFLVYDESVRAGDEVAAVLRQRDSDAIPKSFTVSGSAGGARYERTLLVDALDADGGYLPREWARLEIERLVESGAEAHRDAIVELSKAMYVMSPFTSLLVLEDDAMYTQFGVDRGRKDHWATYAAPDQVPVVREPGAPVGVPSDAEAVLGTVYVRIPRELLHWGNGGGWGASCLSVRDLMQRAQWIPVTFDDALFGTSTWNAAVPGGPSGASFDFDWDGGADFRARTENVFDRSPRNTRWSEFALGMTAGGGGGGGALPSGGTVAFGRLRVGARRWNGGGAGGTWLGDGGLVGPTSVSGPMARLSALLSARDEPVSAGEISLDFLDGSWTRVGIEGKRVASWGDWRRMRGYRGPAGEVPPDTREPADPPPPAWGLAGVWERAASAARGDRITGASAVVERWQSGALWQALQYRRPWLTNDAAAETDLVALAPGFATTLADVRAVLAAETPAPRTGRIDDGARALLDAARAAAPRRIRREGDAGFELTVDGAGRMHFRRTLPNGLVEDVSCDGARLVQAYPEIGLAASRAFSAEHEETLLALVPWHVLSADALSRGADVRLVAERTVAVVPGEGSARLELVFDREARLVERRVADAKGRVVFGERYTHEPGGVTAAWFGADGAARDAVRFAVERVDALPAGADLARLVVLPMPLRQESIVHRQLGLDGARGGDPSKWSDAEALAVLASRIGQRGDAAGLVLDRFLARGDRRPGFLVLLVAEQFRWDPAQPFARGRAALDLDPLRFDAGELGRFLSAAAPGTDAAFTWSDPAGGPLGRRAALVRVLREIRRDQQAGRGIDTSDARIGAILDVAGAQTDPEARFAALCTVWNLGHGHGARALRVAKALDVLVEDPAWRAVARYERASALQWSGDAAAVERGTAEFVALLDEAVAEGALPRLDANFASQFRGRDAPAWRGHFRRAADALVAKGRRDLVPYLALQASWCGEPAFAAALVERVVADASGGERPHALVAALEFQMATGSHARAASLVRELIALAGPDASADLHVMAAMLLESAGDADGALAHRETALDLAFRDLPEMVDLSAVRALCGGVLQRYAAATAAGSATDDHVARVVRTADRWRSVDPEPWQACSLASQALRRMGRADLAWDYATTPLDLRPNESAPWRELGRTLLAQSDQDGADRAFAQAMRLEPTNGEIVWERAEALRGAGRVDAARAVYRVLAEGTWAPPYRGLAEQAREFLR